MLIRDMFAKDINRQINGVVKVADNDEAEICQELSEYVVTRELYRHFAAFFENYEQALDMPTQNMGVWISGFFGSGKSHFLKMLSYLLSNPVVAGKPAIDYFAGKFDDEMVYASARRCAEVPTESILFNIDNKGPSEKDKTAILKVFARVFYEHLGFYGEDLKLARLEHYIERQGKTEAFRTAFERINGDPWIAARPDYEFNSDDVIEALVEADVMSEDEAQRWIDGTAAPELTIDALTNEIKRYVDERARQCGGQFRLLFMVDEVGQYIGADVNLMLNLQTIVEELGAKCRGAVWVMVTSQEAIDEVTSVAGNDFSKIQGRFNTRLSLSSSSVDEVIKRRVLAKTPKAAQVLEASYSDKSAVLKNLFAFEGSKSDLVGYSGTQDFVETFPFASYQFKLMQTVLAEIRKHGSSGKHLAGGERSMLSGFQEAAQRVQERDQNALVPFWTFYDTIHTFLEGHIRRVIDRAREAAEAGQGLKAGDVEVLKLLFLIRYVDDVKPTLGNIAILMADAVDVDKVALRTAVKGSLDRLVRENYVARSGDAYSFLTDEEQDVNREIRETPVDGARVVRKLGEIVYGEIFNARKVRVDDRDFPVDTYVDAALYGASQGGMPLRMVTVVGELHDVGPEALAMRSMDDKGQALVLLSDERNYYDALLMAAKIEKYVQGINVQAQSPRKQDIIRQKNEERKTLELEAKDALEFAIGHARFYAMGREVSVRGSGARQRIEECLRYLAGAVYTKLSYIDAPLRNEGELTALLNGALESFEGMERNAWAVDEVARYLEGMAQHHVTVTVRELQDFYAGVPYGWRGLDVAGVVAQLVRGQRAELRYGGAVIAPTDRRARDCLMQRSEAAKTEVRLRVAVSASVLKKAREVLKDFADSATVPTDEDGLVAAVKRALDEQAGFLQGLLVQEYANVANRDYPYPGRNVAQQGFDAIKGVQGSYGDGAAFLKAFGDAEDGLLDYAEARDEIAQFFHAQRSIFDEAAKLLATMRTEGEYLAGDTAAQAALKEVDAILRMPKPYKSIPKLSQLTKQVQGAYDRLLDAKRRDLLTVLDRAYSEIEKFAEGEKALSATVTAIDQERLSLRSSINSSTTVTELYALERRIGTYRDAGFSKIYDARKAAEEAARAAERERLRQQPIGGKGSSGGQVQPAVPARPAPRPADIKRIPRSQMISPVPLSSEAEIDAFVEKLRAQLKDALRGHDGIQFVG